MNTNTNTNTNTEELNNFDMMKMRNALNQICSLARSVLEVAEWAKEWKREEMSKRTLEIVTTLRNKMVECDDIAHTPIGQ